MGVQGYLSLYTLLLGWQVYDGLWAMLTQTGLILLPFAFISIRCFIGPFLSMGAKDAGVVGARRFIVHIFIALFVLIFAGAPMVFLNPEVLHFKPICATSTQTATPGKTGTTYDHILPVPHNVKVPLLWYLVLAVANGITDQAKAVLSCPTVSLRSLQSRLNLTTIQNTNLKAETLLFYNDCYLPAYDKFVASQNDKSQQTEIKKALKKYGQDDIAWIGSETFQVVPGFYNAYYASKPIQGFPYSGSDPHDQIQGQVGKPTAGVPTCIDWWQHTSIGLRDRLYNEFSNKVKAQITKINYKYWVPPKLVEDAAIRAMLYKSIGGFFSRGYASEEDYKSGVANIYGKWAAKVYTDKLALAEYPKIHILENMLPVIQGVVLFSVCMLLALALPLSGYSIRFCITAAVFIFSMIFCSFLWHAISWFDNFLLQALYGAASTGTYNSPVELIGHLAENAIKPEKNLVDITISIMYIFIPGIWMSMATWSGFKIGGFAAGFAESKMQGNIVGNHSMQGVSKAGSGAWNSFSKGVKGK